MEKVHGGVVNEHLMWEGRHPQWAQHDGLHAQAAGGGAGWRGQGGLHPGPGDSGAGAGNPHHPRNPPHQLSLQEQGTELPTKFSRIFTIFREDPH